MSMTAKEALAAVKQKESDFGKLYKRMKTDADLVKRKPFTLTDSAGKKIPNCEHVTLPKAAIFCNRANAITASANQQIIVTGEGLKDDVTSKLEKFYRYCFDLGDELLSRRNLPKAFVFHSHMVNERGRIGQRVIVEIDDEGKLKVEIVPWDALFVTYDFDKDGMAWASHVTTQGISNINSTYELELTGKTAKVRDWWSRDINFVFVDDKQVLEEANDLGEVPVAIALSPAGLMYQDEDMEVNRGESILWINRDMYKEANKVMSILQTLNKGSLFPPLQKPYEEVPNTQPESPTGGSRTVVPFKTEDGPYMAMPREDVYQATRMSWSIIDSHIQQGSFSTIEFGTLQFPLSAVALENLAEGRELVLAPGLQALSEMYLQSIGLIKKQFILLGSTVELKGEGKEASYASSDIEVDTDITFKYFTGSRKYALAGIAEARDIGDLVSDDYKRRELIKIENPDEEVAKLNSESAEKMHPEIKVYRQLKGLILEEKWGEAWMARLKLRKILMAEYAPQEAAPVPGQTQPQGGMPLFSGAPSRTSGPAEGVTPEETRKAAQESGVE